MLFSTYKQCTKGNLKKTKETSQREKSVRKDTRKLRKRKWVRVSSISCIPNRGHITCPLLMGTDETVKNENHIQRRQIQSKLDK